MKYWTIDILSQLSRDDLLNLFKTISSQLATWPMESAEHHEALDVLADIRLLLNRPARARSPRGWLPPSP